MSETRRTSRGGRHDDAPGVFLPGASGSGKTTTIGRIAEGADAFRDRLEQLDESGGVGAAGYAGLERRLGALMEGTFGEVFRKLPALSWAKQLATPQVTYLSLSATAASEDVELFGRVITQVLKQVCDERMRAIERGENPTPVLIIYDEFAALREAVQVVDTRCISGGLAPPNRDNRHRRSSRYLGQLGRVAGSTESGVAGPSKAGVSCPTKARVRTKASVPRPTKARVARVPRVTRVTAQGFPRYGNGRKRGSPGRGVVTPRLKVDTSPSR